MSPARYPLTLSMSQLIASDAPLTSPISDSSWEQPLYSPSAADSFALNYPHYPHPPSPPYSNGPESPLPANHMLRMRTTPDYVSERDHQLCVPTRQLFDIPPTPPSPSPASSPPTVFSQPSPLPAGSAVKRPSSPRPSICKKARGSSDRITTKDFIPPDVTGLSKREARLVKNRAAAFLSRQRKREEFETMEV